MSPRRTSEDSWRADPVAVLRGAADEFREALLVNPYDPDAVAAAIARAMAMSLSERKGAPITSSMPRCCANDVSKWG